MDEKIFEVRIVEVANMHNEVKKEIAKQVAEKPDSFKRNYKGFAKITYVTMSPTRFKSIEPIEGTIINYFERFRKESKIDTAVF